MAKNPCIFFVPFLAAFCCLQSSSNAQTVQTSSEVTALLNSYSKPLNLTMGREFLAKVHESELGLCLNLNETEYKTSTANTSLASLHVRVTNYSSLKNSVLQFPCLHCPNLTSTSPNAKFVLNNKTVENMTCLAGSRFADDFQVTQQNPFRLSDVLSLSIIDGDMSFVNFSQGEAVHLQMPLVRLPNTSRPYTLSCVTRSLHTSQWSISSCTTNQILKQDNQTSFVQCNCSALGYYTVYVHYNDSSDYNGSSPWNWNYGGGNVGGNPGGGGGVYPTPYTGSLAHLSLSIDADCTILSNATTKADFLNSTRYSIVLALNISVDHIINMVANCGSIVVNFTLLSPDGTNGTLNAELLEFSDLIRSDSFKVPVENNLVYPLTLGISANYNLTIPTSIVSLYYIRKTATTPPVTTEEIQSLTIDYTPFMAAVAAILLVVVTCICGTCCAHSWYLRKKKYTQFNSNKVKPKIEEPVVEEEEEEVTPPEFPMTFTERQEVDERKMSKYDWARTSFAQEQNDTSAFLTSAAAVGPRLIMDCDSDDESESPLPPGDVAINMEEISEESESSGEGSEESTSEDEDDEEYDPRNYECEDSFVESEAQSRASLPPAEDGIRQEGGEHENEESREDEGENKEAEDKQTEGGQTNEDDQDTDDRRNEEENQNPDNDVRQDDDVRGDDVRDDDDTQAGDVTKDDVTLDDNEDSDGMPEDSPPRAPPRDESASSGVNGVMSRNGGMPEPCM